MQKPTILLLTAVVVSGILHAQTPAPPASSPSPAKDQGAQRDLPVPGGGAMLDHPAPTQEEALKTAKQNADAIADLQARRIAQQLSLTSAQFLKVRTILMGRQEELRKALGADSSDPNAQPKTPQERQQRIQEAQQETQRKIAAILTPDQKKQFDAMQARGRAERSRRSAIAASSRRPVIGVQGPTTTPNPGTAPADAGTPAAAPSPAAPANPPAPPQSK
jgi:Spy/CpxP family protein refolding chaperone